MSHQRSSVGAAEAKLERLHAQLADAVAGLVTGDDWARALEFAARFRSRSFNNTVLIWTQHAVAFRQGRVPEPTPTYIAGFKQWLTLGRSVERGQSGYMIFAPVLGRFASPTPEVTKSWRRLAPREAPQHGDVVRTGMVGVRPAYVWDASQTSGAPIPELPRPQMLEGEAPEGLWDGLATLVRGHGYSLRIVGSDRDLGGANGMTDYVTRSVVVRGDMDPAARAKTLAHELAHLKLHGPGNGAATLHHGITEVEAESVALMIGAAHGLDTSGYTIPYVSTWATSIDAKTPVEVVQETGARVRTAALAILESLPTIQMGSGDPPGLMRAAPESSASLHTSHGVGNPAGTGQTTGRRSSGRSETSPRVL
ncbi:ImmA/IrrE family metallo-endopeptidase [Microbacterium sp. zg.Y625]|uniref:ImmA/IrrE family metallo-endopeptidase n=1 Tax=Microbacterium jiangjiandongii TaxID=3049071 RepID=UPI00214C259A|nr:MULTISPECIES: ImmA/IrrE family metallo-endopeptidase [unclassified Microbacterium]MCR2792757.1 ImmA/IrrE family metallo-endopeptidase [Microbacterium sp. zg.Y625]WIM26735.1 ImmA/IrrE family metallo-endopeptidase [Microbacterium sp. zg-Y625]